MLPKAAIDLFDSGYRADYDDSVLFPVFNHPRGHAGLPPAQFQVDGMDPIRDDALIYERVLREESRIDTKLYVYPGLPHGHWAFFPSLKSSAKFRIEQVEGVGWMLGRTPDYSKGVTGATAVTVQLARMRWKLISLVRNGLEVLRTSTSIVVVIYLPWQRSGSRSCL